MGINEKEFAVIREIINNYHPVQRGIAKKVGISLGLTNIIIKRLIKKGYIKIQEVPPRTIIYMLTPKGLAEKSKKSYQYTLRTIDIIKAIKENIQDIINKEYKLGAREFIVSGNGELATLAEIALRDLNIKDINYSRFDKGCRESNLQCNILVVKNGNWKKLNVLLELSKRGIYY